MNKLLLFFFLLGFGIFAHAQIDSKHFRLKEITVSKDTITIDSVSINPGYFRVLNAQKVVIPSSDYHIDFGKAQLVIHKFKNQQITVEYYKYPEFLTKTYAVFDKKRIVPNNTKDPKLYSYTTNISKQNLKPFDGLNTSGNISRGLTIGNNQDAVLNSTLDLQIAGKLSDKVTLRASITDSNIPIQENGYTQQLNEFDRVFIELFSDDWSLKAGDVNLHNDDSYYLNFSKKAAGISVDVNLGNEHEKTHVFASGALVKGKFSSFAFAGQNANQGPYKLSGSNGELFILIISGSERIYVNGVLLKRGEANDYSIDYNTAEITFMPTFPITSEMRIVAEFQFSDRNYTRFVSHDGVSFKSEKLHVSASIYHESDVKSQPLQQDLSNEQKQILANAGNDISQMVVPSSFADAYSENKILYKKVLVGTLETFVYSNDSNDDLFNVRFSNVGVNQGAYMYQETIATGKIYQYVGAGLGDYEPVIQLIAPNKLQVAMVNTEYIPSNKTKIQAELAFSNHDVNLFSKIDDNQNTGLATKIDWQQTLLDSKWKLQSNMTYQFVAQEFKSVERFNTVEFNRDWNVLNPLGNQQLLSTSLRYFKDKKSDFSYTFENLNYQDSFDGTKHTLEGNTQLDKFHLQFIGSALNNQTTIENSTFNRFNFNATYKKDKKWFGVRVASEDNKQTLNATQNLTNFSNKFISYGGFFGLGDSTKVFTEMGYKKRVNDSLRTLQLTQVNTSNTYYIKSKLLATKNTNVSVYANYRTVKNLDYDNVNALNSRVQYRQQLAAQMVLLNTVYETTSGRLPQQEFTYVEVPQGQGFYTWNDYNNNAIQEHNEFEIAQFPDEATFLRVALPNLNYINTNKIKFSQSLTLNPSKWQHKQGIKKALSKYYNQSYLLIDNQQERLGNGFHFNPFNTKENTLLGLRFSIKNNLYYNKGKQHYSTTYSYLKNENKSLLAVDHITSSIAKHQLQFQHKFKEYWLFDVLASTTQNRNSSQNYSNRNYALKEQSFFPKISFLQSKNSHFDVFYEYKSKENSIGNFEQLYVNRFGALYHFSNTKNTSINLEFNYFLNDYFGNQNSPIAYQMLEGLQAGKNYTWNVLLQRKITSYLNLNFSYNGRKSKTSASIHTGNVQLRAQF